MHYHLLFDAKTPSQNKLPEYIRARLYDYRFTTFGERSQTGEWWRRTLKGEYLPAISLEMLQEGQRGR